MLGWTSVTSWLLGGVVFLITLAIWRDRQRYWKFREKYSHLPCPSSYPLAGTMLLFFTKGVIQTFKMWGKQYGKFYMVAPGGTSKKGGIVVADLDLVKEVMVKKFLHFPDRASQSQDKLGKPWTEMLTMIKGDHWKHVRSQLSPTFSTGKIKRMMPAVQRVCASLQDAMVKIANSGEPVELKKLAGTFSMDVIAGIAFGIDVDSTHNPDEPFVKHALAFENPRPLAMMCFILFPRLFGILHKLNLGLFSKECEKFFLDITDAALKEERSGSQKHSDFLRLLVEAQKEGEHQKEVDKEIDHGDQLATSAQWSRKGLEFDEMRANAMLFILAGYGTVSTVLSFAIFELAVHPECLQKAQAEIDEKLGKKLVDYETVNELHYLDMCMNETLRLYPPGFVINREVQEDTELNGVPVEKGMTVNIPVYNIHTDPDIWPDPMKFDPERHTPEARAARHPFAFLPFGMGPRNCIGMRLAQIEVKMAMASVLQKFSPKLCSKSVYPPRLAKIRMSANDGLWVTFEAREQ